MQHASENGVSVVPKLQGNRKRSSLLRDFPCPSLQLETFLMGSHMCKSPCIGCVYLGLYC